MTKTEYEKRIEELEDKQAELQKQLDELKRVKIEEPLKKRWKPEPYHTYYYIGSDGDIYYCCWHNDIVDDWRYLTGNVFRNQKEAEGHKKKIEIQAQLRNFVEERSDELDWNDVGEEKWQIYYSVTKKELRTNYVMYAKTLNTIYASSEQILRDAIAEIGEDNIKKYVLEVEDE